MQVKVDISGIDMSQDIGPLIRSFYPHEEVIISYILDSSDTSDIRSDDKKSDETNFNLQDKEENASIIKKTITVKTYNTGFNILYDSDPMIQVSFEYTDVPDEHMVYEKRRHRAYRNLLLRELYKLLSEKTGRTLPWGILTGVRPTKLCFERLKNNTVGNITYMTGEYLCSPKKAGLAQKVAAKELELLKKFDYNDGYSL